MAGRPVSFAKPDQAQDAGIALVHQEILLAEALTVTDNLFPGRELSRGPVVDDRAMRRLAAEKLTQIGCAVSPKRLCDISLADRQMVQIARALLDDYKVVIFDEPTAVLTGEEVERLLEIVLQLNGARHRRALYQPPPG